MSGPDRELTPIVELDVAEAYRLGRARTLLRGAEGLTAFGIAGGFLGRQRPALSRLAGLSLLAGGACERFGLFEAGIISATDPKYVVVPQRERLERGRQAAVAAGRGGELPAE